MSVFRAHTGKKRKEKLRNGFLFVGETQTFQTEMCVRPLQKSFAILKTSQAREAKDSFLMRAKDKGGEALVCENKVTNYSGCSF